MHTILQWTPNNVWFIGPFDTKDSAVEWAKKDQEEARSGNPCWQYVFVPWINNNTAVSITCDLIEPERANLCDRDPE